MPPPVFIFHPAKIYPVFDGGFDGIVNAPSYVQLFAALFDGVICVSPLYQFNCIFFGVHLASKFVVPEYVPVIVFVQFDVAAFAAISVVAYAFILNNTATDENIILWKNFSQKLQSQFLLLINNELPVCVCVCVAFCGFQRVDKFCFHFFLPFFYYFYIPILSHLQFQ